MGQLAVKCLILYMLYGTNYADPTEIVRVYSTKLTLTMFTSSVYRKGSVRCKEQHFVRVVGFSACIRCAQLIGVSL